MKLFPKAPADPRKQLQDYQLYHSELAILYTNTLALRELVQKGEASLVFQLGLGPGENPFSIANAVGPLLALARNDFYHPETGMIDSKTLSALRAMLSVAEASEEFKAAVAEYEPLLAAVAALDSAETERERERLMAEAAVREAEETAKQNAIAGIANDPAVIAAKKELANL